MPFTTNLAQETATLTKWLVSIPSVTHAKGPALISEAIYNGLSEFPYFKNHPQYLTLQDHEGSAKSSVVALVKGLNDVQDTLVLLCHTDTNSPYHYGMLKSLSTNSDELRQRILEMCAPPTDSLDQSLLSSDLNAHANSAASSSATAANATGTSGTADDNGAGAAGTDAEATEQIPADTPLTVGSLSMLKGSLKKALLQDEAILGLGILESKCATGAMLVALKELSNNSVRLNLNVLFICTSESAIDHHGIKSCLPFIQQLVQREQLNLRLCLNTQPNLPQNANDQALHLYTGNYGKVEPSFYIIGNSSAAYRPYEGFSASIIAAELIRALELNPKLTRKLQAKPMVPTFDSLRVKEFGKDFSPDGMQVSFNLPISNLNLDELLDTLKEVAAQAIENAADLVESREAAYAQMCHEDYRATAKDAEVVSFSDLLERASHNFKGNLHKALQSMVQKCRSEGLSLHQASITIIERLNELARLPRPSIVVYYTDNFVPTQGLNANSSQDREIFMILDALLKQFAKLSPIVPVMEAFYAPTDANFLRPNHVGGALQTLAKECPLGIEPQHFQGLNVPTITLGVGGGDMHMLTEYVHSDMCQYLPAFILGLSEAMGQNPEKSLDSVNANDLQRHLDEIARQASSIAEATIHEIQNIEKQKQQDGFYAEVTQGTLTPHSLDSFFKPRASADHSLTATTPPSDQPIIDTTNLNATAALHDSNNATLEVALASANQEPSSTKDSTSTAPAPDIPEQLNLESAAAAPNADQANEPVEPNTPSVLDKFIMQPSTTTPQDLQTLLATSEPDYFFKPQNTTGADTTSADTSGADNNAATAKVTDNINNVGTVLVATQDSKRKAHVQPNFTEEKDPLKNAIASPLQGDSPAAQALATAQKANAQAQERAQAAASLKAQQKQPTAELEQDRTILAPMQGEVRGEPILEPTKVTVVTAEDPLSESISKLAKSALSKLFGNANNQAPRTNNTEPSAAPAPDAIDAITSPETVASEAAPALASVPNTLAQAQNSKNSTKTTSETETHPVAETSASTPSDATISASAPSDVAPQATAVYATTLAATAAPATKEGEATTKSKVEPQSPATTPELSAASADENNNIATTATPSNNDVKDVDTTAVSALTVDSLEPLHETDSKVPHAQVEVVASKATTDNTNSTDNTDSTDSTTSNTVLSSLNKIGSFFNKLDLKSALNKFQDHSKSTAPHHSHHKQEPIFAAGAYEHQIDVSDPEDEQEPMLSAVAPAVSDPLEPPEPSIPTMPVMDMDGADHADAKDKSTAPSVTPLEANKLDSLEGHESKQSANNNNNNTATASSEASEATAETNTTTAAIVPNKAASNNKLATDHEATDQDLSRELEAIVKADLASTDDQNTDEVIKTMHPDEATTTITLPDDHLPSLSQFQDLLIAKVPQEQDTPESKSTAQDSKDNSKHHTPLTTPDATTHNATAPASDTTASNSAASDASTVATIAKSTASTTQQEHLAATASQSQEESSVATTSKAKNKRKAKAKTKDNTAENQATAPQLPAHDASPTHTQTPTQEDASQSTSTVKSVSPTATSEGTEIPEGSKAIAAQTTHTADATETAEPAKATAPAKDTESAKNTATPTKSKLSAVPTFAPTMEPLNIEMASAPQTVVNVEINTQPLAELTSTHAKVVAPQAATKTATTEPHKVSTKTAQPLPPALTEIHITESAPESTPLNTAPELQAQSMRLAYPQATVTVTVSPSDTSAITTKTAAPNTTAEPKPVPAPKAAPVTSTAANLPTATAPVASVTVAATTNVPTAAKDQRQERTNNNDWGIKRIDPAQTMAQLLMEESEELSKQETASGIASAVTPTEASFNSTFTAPAMTAVVPPEQDATHRALEQAKRTSAKIDLAITDLIDTLLSSESTDESEAMTTTTTTTTTTAAVSSVAVASAVAPTGTVKGTTNQQDALNTYTAHLRSHLSNHNHDHQAHSTAPSSAPATPSVQASPAAAMSKQPSQPLLTPNAAATATAKPKLSLSERRAALRRAMYGEDNNGSKTTVNTSIANATNATAATATARDLAYYEHMTTVAPPRGAVAPVSTGNTNTAVGSGNNAYRSTAVQQGSYIEFNAQGKATHYNPADLTSRRSNLNPTNSGNGIMSNGKGNGFNNAEATRNQRGAAWGIDANTLKANSLGARYSPPNRVANTNNGVGERGIYNNTELNNAQGQGTTRNESLETIAAMPPVTPLSQTISTAPTLHPPVSNPNKTRIEKKDTPLQPLEVIQPHNPANDAMEPVASSNPGVRIVRSRNATAQAITTTPSTSPQDTVVYAQGGAVLINKRITADQASSLLNHEQSVQSEPHYAMAIEDHRPARTVTATSADSQTNEENLPTTIVVRGN